MTNLLAAVLLIGNTAVNDTTNGVHGIDTGPLTTNFYSLFPAHEGTNGRPVPDDKPLVRFDGFAVLRGESTPKEVVVMEVEVESHLRRGVWVPVATNDPWTKYKKWFTRMEQTHQSPAARIDSNYWFEVHGSTNGLLFFQVHTNAPTR